MTLEEKTKIGVMFMSQARQNAEPKEVEGVLWSMMYYCILNNIRPEEMIEILCLGMNEIQINSIADSFVDTLVENTDKTGSESYNTFIKVLKEVAVKMDMPEAVDGAILPYNMIFGEALIKAGHAIMAKPDFFKGD